MKLKSSRLKVLDFDLESRPLGWIGSDFVHQEITVAAWGWMGELPQAKALGKDERSRLWMLRAVRKAYDEADMVVGHYIRCVAPQHRVLTADLRWVPAGDLNPGDKLIAFQETLPHSGARRQLEIATVLSNTQGGDRLFRVELETGEVIYTTAEHPWYVSSSHSPGQKKHKWRRTDQLLRDDHPWKPALATKVFEPWGNDSSWGAGWLSGFFDGEGTLSRETAAKSQLTVSQNPGPVHDMALHLLHQKGFTSAVSGVRSAKGRVRTIRLNGGTQDKFRFLGQIRPLRLLNTWLELAGGRPGAFREQAAVGVKSVTQAGQGDVSRLSTTSGTYIAEGYAMHNSYDLPLLNAMLIEEGEPALSQKLTHDTMLDLPKMKGVSKSQVNLAAMWGIDDQKVYMTVPAWREANRLTKQGVKAAVDRAIDDVSQNMALYAHETRHRLLKPPSVWRPV